MNITAKHYKKLLDIIERMHEHSREAELRADIAEPLLDLLEADYFASFCWNSNDKRYDQGVYLNMEDSNIGKYCEYFQFHDPITSRLAQKRTTTAVSEIMPHKELRKTEFFNDFLLADGLYHGINLHIYHYQENIGDLRIWRKQGRGDFDTHACEMLDLLKPHLIQAIKNVRRLEALKGPLQPFSLDDQCLLLKRRHHLTTREIGVARLLLQGEGDTCIANSLNISLTTVRTHIKNIFRKTGINSRGKLQSAVYHNETEGMIRRAV